MTLSDRRQNLSVGTKYEKNKELLPTGSFLKIRIDSMRHVRHTYISQRTEGI